MRNYIWERSPSWKGDCRCATQGGHWSTLPKQARGGTKTDKMRNGDSYKRKPDDVHAVTYKRFRRWINQRNSSRSPAASTPVVARWQCHPNLEFDTVCRRLELEPAQTHQGPAQKAPQDHLQAEASLVGSCNQAALSLNTSRARQPDTERSPEQKSHLLWRAAGQVHGHPQQAGTTRMSVYDSKERRDGLQPFVALNKPSMSLQSKPVMMLGAPSLRNDYYSNLLDCSCDGMIALALGSSVYLWNSETQTLVGYLETNPDRPHRGTLSISCLCWSKDGRVLGVGNRRGEIELWDVDHKQKMRYVQPHLTALGALSWKQHLLSSGSALGDIHHLDPRAPTPVVGMASQKGGVCSLQWSPGEDQLASGSVEGLLHIWDSDITGSKGLHQPVMTMEQPSAVKALGWCPWQKGVIATGGGWKDGELRVWDTQSGSCLTSVNTNSQICSLRWAEKMRYLVTGHGLPHHQITSWMWEFPTLRWLNELTGHSHRVLHLAINPDNTRIFSAGADQRFHIWDL